MRIVPDRLLSWRIFSGTARSQLLLLPEAVDDYVGSDNPVRFIEAFVDGLDLTAAGCVRVGVAMWQAGRKDRRDQGQACPPQGHVGGVGPGLRRCGLRRVRDRNSVRPPCGRYLPCLPLIISCRLKVSTTSPSASKRAFQTSRRRSIQPATSSSPRNPSRQVRTHPTFSRTPTCYLMPVRVMWNFSASSVIEASSLPSCSRTPRRVASESAAKESSRRSVNANLPIRRRWRIAVETEFRTGSTTGP